MDGDTQLDLIVSIVNHNSVEALRECLPTVLASLDGLRAEVWVVDNACAERAAPVVRAEFPQVRVLENEAVLGFGANHNQVMRRALDRSRYVFVLNPDTRLPPDALRRMVASLDAHPRTGMLGVSVAYEDGRVQPLPREVIHLPRDLLMLTVYISHWPGLLTWLERANQRRKRRPAGPTAPSDSGMVEAAAEANTGVTAAEAEAAPSGVVSGAAMMLRSAAVREVGFFDEAFFLYFEEYDWCYRARRAGWEVRSLPGVEIIHTGGRSTSRHDYYYYFMVRLESWVRFYQKHGGPVRWRVLAGWMRALAGLNLARLAAARALGQAHAEAQQPRREFLYRLMRSGARAARPAT